MSVGEALSIVSSVVSFFLGAFSVWLALYFYVQTKNTEKEITNSLSKIEAQTAALQKINAKWMDRLIQSATDATPSATETIFPQLITVLAELPKTITSHISNPKPSESNEALMGELITAYISIYYYSALANFFSQIALPDPADFDESNSFHSTIRRVVDGSDADFAHMAGILQRVDRNRIERNVLVELLNVTRDVWRPEVRSSSEVYVDRAKNRAA